MQNAAPFITDKYWQVIIDSPHIAPVYHACILRCVQVELYKFWHNVATNIATSYEGVDLPDLCTLVTELKRGAFHTSSHWVPIPEAFRDTPSTRTASSVSQHPPSVASTSGSTVASARTGVSTLTNETRATVPVERIANPAPDAAFTSITVRPGGTRPILREHRPPANDAGHEFCLAWWLRGACFANCGRRQTHHAFASPGERTRLLNFCREHIATPP